MTYESEKHLSTTLFFGGYLMQRNIKIWQFVSDPHSPPRNLQGTETPPYTTFSQNVVCDEHHNGTKMVLLRFSLGSFGFDQCWVDI
jgi:hypothetical protein